MRTLPRKYEPEEGIPNKESNRDAECNTLQKDLQSFYVAGKLHLDSAELDEGEGIAETLLKHNASWHKSCCVKYNTANAY